MKKVKRILEKSWKIRKQSVEIWKVYAYRPEENEPLILAKEKEHQEGIIDLSKQSTLLTTIGAILDEEIEYKRSSLAFHIKEEAFLVAMASKDISLIEGTIASNSNLYARMLSFLNLEEVDLYFQALQQDIEMNGVGKQAIITIINFIQINNLDHYLDIFLTHFNNLSERYKKFFCSYAYGIPKFKPYLITCYKENPKIVGGGLEDEYLGQKILAANEEKLGLAILRDKKNILSSSQYSSLLNIYGDKSDAYRIIEEVKGLDIDELIDFIRSLVLGGGNYIYVDFLLELLKKEDPALSFVVCDLLQYYYFIDYEDPEMKQLNNILEILNNLEYGTPIDELSPDERKIIEVNYILNFWEQVYEKNKHKIDTTKRINLDSGGLYSIEELLEYQLGQSAFINSQDYLYDFLLIFTGQRFPLDQLGYFGKLREHTKVWQQYIADNKVQYADGRWWRFGHYVDEQYTLIDGELDDEVFNSNALSK